MKMTELAILGALLLSGCATHTLAELEADPRDSLTVQRTEHPKMFARANTTVGAMRVDLRECGTAPTAPTPRTASTTAARAGRRRGAQAADFFSLAPSG